MNLRELDATIQRHVAYNQQILLCVSMTTEVAVSLAEQGDDQEVVLDCHSTNIIILFCD